MRRAVRGSPTSSPPTNTTRNAQKLNSIMETNNNNNNNNNDDDDLDADLRSLLSDGSGSANKNSSVPGTPSKLAASKQQQQQRESEGALSSLLNDQTMEHPHHHQNKVTGQLQQQQQQHRQQGHITHLASSSWEDNNTFPHNNSSNMSDVMNNNNPPHTTTMLTRRKKLLLTLGTIILCMGLLGPSGILWNLFDDDYEYNSDNSGIGVSLPSSSTLRTKFDTATTTQQSKRIGDKHHHLPNGEINNIDGNVWLRKRNTKPFKSARQKKREQQKKNGSGINTKKNNGNGDDKDNSPIHSNIKEAIANIDKVFLDEHPTYNMNNEKTNMKRKKKKKQQRLEKQNQLRVGNFLGGNTDTNNNDVNDGLDGEYDDDDAYFMLQDADENNLPVIHVDDNNLPEHAEELDTNLPASEALECRASVVAFVINATDVKDECDGLRKAFDRTCSVQQHSTSNSGGSGGSNGGGQAAAGGNNYAQRRRRRLQERGKPQLSNLLSVTLRRELSNVVWHVKSHVQRLRQWRWGDNDDDSENETFRMQEEIWVAGAERMGTRHRILKAMDLIIEERRGEEEKPPQSIAEAIEGVPSGQKEEEDESATVQQQQKKEEPPPPMISLNIPTAEKHISEETLNDALLLQESEEGVNTMASVDQQQQQQQPSEAEEGTEGSEATNDAQTLDEGAKTNAEAAVAAKDAAESAEAIRTATAAVKNIMNDPKSVEARTCCASILSVFHDHCDPTTTGVEDYSDRRLLVVVFVITVCGMVKSIIRHLNIRWLPEAGGCILVGVLGYVILSHMPHVQFAFDGDMFLRIMVPPIVFEAAVKINKQSFRRHAIPITIYAIIGTLASTAFTAVILHKGSSMMSCTTIPMKESMIFGALISSIDPIAVLSVLNSMGMTDTDTVYILIFGESLLNDGVAIVLFQTLVHFLDETLVVDTEVIFDAIIHFIVVAVGSLSVGILSGASATVYFATMHGCQTPLVECIMFFCWAIIPYYICDMVEWSGIVAIVANGFVMDLFVVGQKRNNNVDEEIDHLVNGTVNGNNRARSKRQQCRSFFNYEGHLSDMANSHVHFVIEIFATLMETAIFAYLGLFLFSSRYHWSASLTIISIFATVMGRIIMIPTLSHVANVFNRMRGQRSRSGSPRGEINESGVHIDRRMQLVLIFAGLRGAMSFALVEHIPMFDTTTGQGSRLKPELKSMTSASVIFTVFILGGATSYLLERLGYSITKEQDAVEIAPLMQRHKKETPFKGRQGNFPSVRGIGSIRQRAQPRDTI